MKRNSRYTEPIERRNRFSTIFPIVTIVGIGISLILSSAYEDAWLYNWDGIRNEIKDSIKAVEHDRVIETFILSDDNKGDRIRKQNWIMNSATETEFLKLTEYPNGKIKAIAYEGLLRRPEFETKLDLLLKAITDNDHSVYLQVGCEAISMSISRYLVEFVLQIDDRSPPFLGEKTNFGLTRTEEIQILTEYRKEADL